MAEEGYRARISADEARKAMVGILPNVSLSVMGNYDSNRFLVNNNWYSLGLNVALNLTKVFSIPAMNRSEEAQNRADDARRQAMAMAVLAQTRIAAVRYTLVADEFMVWDEAARDRRPDRAYPSSEAAGIDNELEVVRGRVRDGEPHQPRPRLCQRAGGDRAPLQLGRLRHGAARGRGAPARRAGERGAGALRRVRARELLAARGAEKPVVAIGEVSGVRPRVAALVGEVRAACSPAGA